MSEKESKSKLWEYWQANVRTNYKKISAIFGSMVTMVIGLTLYGFKTELDLLSILMTVIFAMQPFLTVLVNIMFKGESELKDKEISLLKQEIEFKRDLTEYQLQVVALKCSADWDKYNVLLEHVDVVKASNLEDLTENID